MLNLLLRIGLVLFGLLFVAEVFRPIQVEDGQVNRKAILIDLGGFSIPLNGARIYLHGNKNRTCNFSLSTYGRLEVGDQVSVSLTDLTNTCVGLKRGDDVIESTKFWKPLHFVFGFIIFFAALFGKFSKTTWNWGNSEIEI